MGSSSREKSLFLGEKLRQIREAMNLSQTEMVERLGWSEKIHRGHLARFEADTREPALPLLLRYARLANVIVDVLIDDDLELPSQLPSPERHEGIPRKTTKSARTPKS